MTAMVASDLNNPAFVGAINPDTLLHVEFYMHEPEDVHKSEAAGKVVRLPAQPYIRIQNPGDKTSVVESPVFERHKARWPDKWLYFQIKEGLVEGAADVPGWKVEEWTHLNPEQVRELKFLRFSVVEQVAGASDEQIQKLGMGGLGLREAARQALRARMGAETREAMEKKDAEISALKQANLEMQEKFAKFEAFMAAAGDKPQQAAKRG